MADTAPILAAAAALATAALASAKTDGEALLTSVADDAITTVPKFGTDSAALLQEFVPAQFAPYVDPILAMAEGALLPTLENDAVTAIKTGLGIALARINSLG